MPRRTCRRHGRLRLHGTRFPPHCAGASRRALLRRQCRDATRWWFHFGCKGPSPSSMRVTCACPARRGSDGGATASGRSRVVARVGCTLPSLSRGCFSYQRGAHSRTGSGICFHRCWSAQTRYGDKKGMRQGVKTSGGAARGGVGPLIVLRDERSGGTGRLSAWRVASVPAVRLFFGCTSSTAGFPSLDTAPSTVQSVANVKGTSKKIESHHGDGCGPAYRIPVRRHRPHCYRPSGLVPPATPAALQTWARGPSMATWRAAPPRQRQ